MPDPSSKPRLIEAMLSARGEFDALIRQIPLSKMALRAAPAEWSVKDIVAHVNSYDRWLALGLALRAQKPPDLWIADIPLDELNHRIYEANRDLPLEEVLRESRELWENILKETEGKPEEYLFTEQTVPGVPYSFRPCEMLKSESYGHYLDHVPPLRSRLEADQQAQAESGPA
jgi:hypothetical protein